VSTTTIDDLVRRAQAGEQDALVAFVQRYQSYVYSLALGIMRDPVDAADMTQETFIRVLRTLPTFRGENARLTTWLYRLTTNICLDGLRRRGPLTEPLDGTFDPADTEATSEARLEARETAREVRSALRRLPSPQRAALVLHYFNDLSYDQIADTLSLPLNTVKSHIHRGKQRLASLLYSPPAAVAA
jgi:RNA polymerase sigma-70 factor, ECF subfamily